MGEPSQNRSGRLTLERSNLSSSRGVCVSSEGETCLDVRVGRGRLREGIVRKAGEGRLHIRVLALVLTVEDI